VSELSEMAQRVLESLEQNPTLNTPALIMHGPQIHDEISKEEVEAALHELVEAGKVKHRPTGWRVAR
jgi:predicted oxidoreductase